MPVFGNWEVVARGWYFAMPSRDLPVGKAASLDLCGQRVVLFRGEDGRVRALDGYCPHMGTDLGIGTVVGDTLRCFFHHWRYDGEGRCVEVPCAPAPPPRARLQPYAAEERFGFIWVNPDPTPRSGVPGPAELEGEEVDWVHGIRYRRSCHHHVTMINGIDPQHLRTVHGIEIDMAMELDEDPERERIDITLTGALPRATLRQRALRGLIGDSYSYRMRYGGGSVGCLTVMKGTRLLGRGPELPELYMIFAYRPVAPGLSEVQPIYLTRRRRGLLGRLVARGLLGAMKLGFRVLRDEDGKVYENMRFRPHALLEIDQPVARFIRFVNRLEPSVWSHDLAAPPRPLEA
jgi:nitrite reductase/ring-hydroxylating ferredoxin subunit